ncbi:hypothetical protein EK904_013445, partial [Melospiza melodia maxima]
MLLFAFSFLQELQRNPHLITDGVSRFDIMQGEIGDCWMLAALGSLTLRKQFLENVLPKDQGFQEDYAGIFHFRFWQYGEWVDVVIDDRLPFLNGRYLSVHPRTSNEFWPSLLEKAYAKLQGSYQNLNGGYLSDALVDLTGGVQVQFSLKEPPSDLEEILRAADRSRCLMGCSTSGQSSRNIELRNGIVQGHAYTVTGAVKVPYKNAWKHIIRIWNPWGHGEWKGPWTLLSGTVLSLNTEKPSSKIRMMENSDEHGTAAWSLTSYTNLWSPGLPSRRSRYSRGKGCSLHSPGGVLLLIDVKIHSEHRIAQSIDRQHLSAKQAETKQQQRWLLGGASTNPQYFFKVLDHNPKTCNVAISLMQKPAEHMQHERNLGIGFFITTENSRVLKQTFLQARDVTSCLMLSPGTYAVVPAAAEDQEFQFLLRIFIKNQDYHEANPVGMEVQLEWPGSMESRGSTIDASQLQQLLNEVISQ